MLNTVNRFFHNIKNKWNSIIVKVLAVAYSQKLNKEEVV